MSKTDDPDFINYLHQENSYADAFMADTPYTQKYLYDYITTNRKNYHAFMSSDVNGSWLYSQWIPKGKEYPVISRKLVTEGNCSWYRYMINLAKQVFVSEQVLVDFNQIGNQQGYVHVNIWKASPDNRYLAYTLDTSGDERYILRIVDIQNKCVLVKQINNVCVFTWAKDSRYLFYTVSEENQSHFRPYKVKLTKLGSNDDDDDDDVVVYTEYDSCFRVFVYFTADGKYVIVVSGGRSSCEVYAINADKPLGELTIIHKRLPGVLCDVEHHHGFFYLRTNAPVSSLKSRSGNYYLARCRVEDLELNVWQIVVPPAEDVNIEGMEMFNEHMVLNINKNGLPMTCSIKLPIDMIYKKDIMNIDDLEPWYFPVPSDSCTIHGGEDYKNNFMSSVCHAVISSPVMSAIEVEYDMSQNKSSLEVQEEMLDFFDEYAFERKEVISHDGVIIPLTILYCRTTCHKGKSPGILHEYGSFGDNYGNEPLGDLQASLLDDGWVFAFADVRGGSGIDPDWHEKGSGINKINSIKDFVACGEYLINEGYVHKHRLAAKGTSAGGLLVGAAINLSPNLFRAAILDVPSLDLCNTLMDPRLPITLGLRDEYGNPEIKSELESIMRYSPYNNIQDEVSYPSMLVTSNLHDARVGVWEGAKWVAKIRESRCNSNSSVLLKTCMTGGHLHPDQTRGPGLTHEEAFEYIFLIKLMEMYDAEK